MVDLNLAQVLNLELKFGPHAPREYMRLSRVLYDLVNLAEIRKDPALDRLVERLGFQEQLALLRLYRFLQPHLRDRDEIGWDYEGGIIVNLHTSNSKGKQQYVAVQCIIDSGIALHFPYTGILLKDFERAQALQQAFERDPVSSVDYRQWAPKRKPLQTPKREVLIERIEKLKPPEIDPELEVKPEPVQRPNNQIYELVQDLFERGPDE